MPRHFRKWFHRFILSSPLTDFYDRFFSVPALGDRGELAAKRHLLRQGMVIVESGYQDNLGEIDLIAVDDQTIVFVEVKTRSGDVAGDPTEAVNDEKQKRITKTAQGYLKWHRLIECRVRFDVIAIIWPSGQKRPQITHYENAFEPTGRFQMF